jgi:hypothetical protein
MSENDKKGSRYFNGTNWSKSTNADAARGLEAVTADGTPVRKTINK